ncbi:MAG: IPT/TIG domain-containing protein [Acidobacteriia bacterium]|nr:IPT/TIG domain-containing protein [Terriglobia bacterium]
MKPVGLVALWAAFAAVAAAQQPTVSSGGVVNSASFTKSNPPGSLVTIFGTNMAKAGELLKGSSTPLTMQLQSSGEDVSVTVNGQPAPMFYVTATQTSVQLPWATIAGTGSIVVTRNGVKSSPQSLQVATFSPGIFTVNQQGTKGAWVINNNDGSVAQPAAGWPFPSIATRPAKAGDNLYFYITGLGPVSPSTSMKDGHAPCPLSGCPANVVLPKTTTTPTVLIGSVAIPAANLQFSGLSPQFVGTYQVNFQMPSGVAASDTTTLEVEIGGVTSNKVTFATQ